MSELSIYPDAIDGYAQLPLAIDNVTRVDAVTVNRLRCAIINIENELGVLPSGVFDTVRVRLDGLEGASASLVADALRKVGLDPRRLTMSTDIRPVAGHDGPIAGPAVTTKWELTREGMSGPAIRRFVFEPVDDAPAGSIWVIESGTERLLSMFGDVIGLACQRKGMSGAITDSGCRDVAAMTSYGFPVFAKGTVLYGPGDAISPSCAVVSTCGRATSSSPMWMVSSSSRSNRWRRSCAPRRSFETKRTPCGGKSRAGSRLRKPMRFEEGRRISDSKN